MLTAKSGVLLSNGVFVRNKDFVKVIFTDNEIISGQVKHFMEDANGIYGVLIFNKECMEEYDIIFNEFVKDIQLA